MRISVILLLTLGILNKLNAGIFPDYSYQDTIRIDTSDYIPNDHDFNLIIASFNGYSSEVLRLLNLGADVNTRTYDGITPLMYAVQNGDLMTVKILVLNGADIGIKPDEGAPAIIAAARYDFLDIVEFLIRNGANVNSTDNDGASSLHYAAGYYYYELADSLLMYGANPEARDKAGTTPLMAAVYGGNPDIIHLLADYKADMNRQDNDGYTAMMIAAQNGDTAMIGILADYRANLDLLNKEGYTAIAIAVRYGHTDAVRLLKDLGANIREAQKRNLHSLAIEYGHTRLARELLQYGIKPRRIPSFSRFFLAAGFNTSFNELMGGGELGLNDPRYKIDICAGYQVRLFAKRILKEMDDNTYVQLWENRSLAYFGIEKNFRLFKLPDNKEAGLSFGILGGYTFGKNYRGSLNGPADELKVIPSAGAWWGGQKIKMDINYQYLDFETFKISPHRFIITVKYTFSLRRSGIEDKVVEWY